MLLSTDDHYTELTKVGGIPPSSVKHLPLKKSLQGTGSQTVPKEVGLACVSEEDHILTHKWDSQSTPGVMCMHTSPPPL